MNHPPSRDGRPWRLTLYGITLAVFVAAWFLLGAFSATTLSVLVIALYYGVAGSSFNFLYGSVGLFSIAQPVFIAVGGFTGVYLYNHFGLSPWISILVAMAIAAAVALPIGLIMLSREGTVLTALVTLIVAEAIPAIVASIKALGGAQGLQENALPGSNLAKMQFNSGLPFARILLVLNLFIIIGVMVFRQSRMGYWCAAVKDSPLAAEACGLAARRLRLIVFVLAAMIAAPAGVVYAQYTLAATTDVFLAATTLFEVLVVALVGGWARPWGAVVGAVAMSELSFHLTNAFPNRAGVSALAFGLVFLIVALVIPRGLSGAWDARPDRLRLHKGRSTGGLLPAPVLGSGAHDGQAPTGTGSASPEHV